MMVGIPRLIVWMILWSFLVSLGRSFRLKVPKGSLIFFVKILGMFLNYYQLLKVDIFKLLFSDSSAEKRQAVEKRKRDAEQAK